MYTLCWWFLFLQKKRLQGKQENKNKIYLEKKNGSWVDCKQFSRSHGQCWASASFKFFSLSYNPIYQICFFDVWMSYSKKKIFGLKKIVVVSSTRATVSNYTSLKNFYNFFSSKFILTYSCVLCVWCVYVWYSHIFIGILCEGCVKL